MPFYCIPVEYVHIFVCMQRVLAWPELQQQAFAPGLAACVVLYSSSLQPASRGIDASHYAWD